MRPLRFLVPFVLLPFSAAALADSQRFDIPAQPLAEALKIFADQSRMQLLYKPDAIDVGKSNPVVGDFDKRQALELLLRGTGLEIVFSAENAATVRPIKNAPHVPSAARADSEHPRLARAPAARAAMPGEASLQSTGLALEEVIVTATKREENVRRVAGSVSAMTGAQLEQLGAQSFADYVGRSPGVVFNAAAPGYSNVTIRGISTTNGIDQGQGTTGIYIDDVSLTDPYASVGIPDIDAFDVQRVEVLRGPQGTLFGAASLGGAVNYISAKPDLHDFASRIEARTTSTHNSHEPGYAAKAMVNAPLVDDQLAVRGVFVYRSDAGYIDNLGTNSEGSNDSFVRGGRVLATWQPADGTRISSLNLFQQTHSSAAFYQTPVLGDLRASTLIPESSSYETRLHTLRLDQELGFANLVAMAAYHEKQQESHTDTTPLFGALVPGLNEPVRNLQLGHSHGMTYEVRLASASDGPLQWLAGAMHDDTRERIPSTSAASGAASAIEARYAPIFGAGVGGRVTAGVGRIHYSEIVARGQESALFGETSYAFTDQWKLTVGGRFFDIETSLTSPQGGLITLLSTGAVDATAASRHGDTGFTPKISLAYQHDDDLLIYGLASQGYRFGGPNFAAPSAQTPVPSGYDSDSLWNHEIGVRSAWLEDRLQLDATLFYIDWKDIQVRLATPQGFGYGDNAGGARSRGAEVTARWRATRGLELRTDITYLDAELTENFTLSGRPVTAGTTLPGASEWLISNLITYDLPVVQAIGPRLSLSHRYVSEAPGQFNSAFEQGGYHLYDARLGFSLGDNMTVDVFADNLADERGITNTTLFGGVLREYFIRPRTIGVSFGWNFL